MNRIKIFVLLVISMFASASIIFSVLNTNKKDDTINPIVKVEGISTRLKTWLKTQDAQTFLAQEIGGINGSIGIQFYDHLKDYTDSILNSDDIKNFKPMINSIMSGADRQKTPQPPSGGDSSWPDGGWPHPGQPMGLGLGCGLSRIQYIIANSMPGNQHELCVSDCCG